MCLKVSNPMLLKNLTCRILQLDKNRKKLVLGADGKVEKAGKAGGSRRSQHQNTLGHGSSMLVKAFPIRGKGLLKDSQRLLEAKDVESVSFGRVQLLLFTYSGCAVMYIVAQSIFAIGASMGLKVNRFMNTDEVE